MRSYSSLEEFPALLLAEQKYPLEWCLRTGENCRVPPYCTTSSVSSLTHMSWGGGLPGAVQDRLKVPSPSSSTGELTLEILTGPRSEVIVSVRSLYYQLSDLQRTSKVRALDWVVPSL